jgi:hypothetical protein
MPTDRQTEPTILMLMPFFGQWPVWFDLYLESCQWNPTVHWLFFTDCGEPANRPPNVRFVTMSKAELEARIQARLGVQVSLHDSYKLCDLKPTYGELFADYLTGYDYWGYGDVDVIYGNIRRFYTPQVLTHDLISTHGHILAGHFALLRNKASVIHAFRRCRGWRRQLTAAGYQHFDEVTFSQRLTRFQNRPAGLRLLFRWLTGRFWSCYLVEQYSTILLFRPTWQDGTREYPSEWYWQQGRLTTNKSGDQEFLYLHFMQWKSSRYLIRELGERSAWEQLAQVVNVDVATAAKHGFTISRAGFQPLCSTL